MESGHDAAPGVGPTESLDGLSPSEQANIALLRLNLMEAEPKADLWKEQNQEASTEYIQCKSNAKILRISLESTQKELSLLREEHRNLGELVRGLRAELTESKEKLAKVDNGDARTNNAQGCNCNADSEALKMELESTRKDLTRMKDEYEKQRRLSEELRRDQERELRPPFIGADRDNATAKRLEEQFNERKPGGGGVPSDFPVGDASGSWEEILAVQYPITVQDRSGFLELYFAEALEDAGIRHCVVGDVVAWLLGSEVTLFDTFILIADEQLDAARDKNPDGWPGFRFAEPHRELDDDVGIKLVPASFWKFELGRDVLYSNTVVFPERRFRFPVPVYYIRVLIALLVERFGSPSTEDENPKLLNYFKLTFGYLITHIPDDLISQLPPEDQLFVKFFMISPNPTRKKLYRDAQWDQVRQGTITKEEAERHIEMDEHMVVKREHALERGEPSAEMY